jgi:D-serine deaminase-like pyridoxal phosphate-dependent protein
MLAQLRSHTVVVANVAHLQPVVSEHWNVLYRGPGVVEVAIDSPIPALVSWVVDSQDQLDALKDASQKLSVRYRVVMEVDVRFLTTYL